MRPSAGEVGIREGDASECEVCADMLAERTAFAAFPWLKPATRHEFEGFHLPTGLVVERTKFYAQIVALINKVTMFLQLVQTCGWFFTQTLPELVAFV